jgi:tRNA (guanine37-N1)-methyltransferase
MEIFIATLFPESLRSYFESSILAKGLREGIFSLHIENIADHSVRSTRRADDRPFGWFPGTILAPEPTARAMETCEQIGEKGPIQWFAPDPRWEIVDQSFFQNTSNLKRIWFLCWHYEGIDERIFNEFAIKKVSLGNFVITGWELGAAVMIDATVRLIPGLLSEASLSEESFSVGLSGKKEYPQYTRPQIWRWQSVPDDLVSGNHKQIEIWKKMNVS